MSNIDKQVLREAAEKALSARERLALMESVFEDDGEDVKTEAQDDISICISFNELTNPATVLALLDELEAAEKRLAELDAKKVTIKLPESFYPDGDIDCPLVINEYQIIEAIVAADCKPIAVCQRCKCELDLSHKPDGAHYCHPAAAGKGE